eukprot:NODE_14275_length_1118_cov_5.109990.p1 GENE.NODE_14275_length_1118_cov_5.109990~~NODE_14275_length_1118_cov_5.109990.p1  ORF type:complete len:241 (-),score=74.47 NODE_14275_length_1118_cov_5.109990:297-1019(-)
MASPISVDEAAQQTRQMRNFIINEAQEKAEDIRMKHLEEVNIEKHKLLSTRKEQVRQEFEVLRKKAETESAIKRSCAVNNARLAKITRRQEMISKVSGRVRTDLARELVDEQTSKDLLLKLIVQGLLGLLEDDVVVRCRKCDLKVVQSVVGSAAKQYSGIIQEQSGADRTVNITVDQTNFLHPPPSEEEGPSCLGGVVLHCQRGTISIDNTIDTRLLQVIEQDKPAIRQQLFAPVMAHNF